MTFRCLFIIKTSEIDHDERQSFCYKPFGNSPMRNNHSQSYLPLQNFNMWYEDIVSLIVSSNYTKFDENSIGEYLLKPVFKIETKFGSYWPCIIIVKNNFAYGGLLNTDREYFDNYYDSQWGSSINFIYLMSIYFTEMIKTRSPKLKMSDMLQEFYQFIQIMCPFGTPLSSNTALIDYFKLPESALKSINMLAEKTKISISNYPVNITTKNKDVKVVVQEMITGVQHESKSGGLRYDIDIIGEVIVSTSNFHLNEEISFTLRPMPSHKILLKTTITDVLLHPTCIDCSYLSPTTISLRKKVFNVENSERNFDDSVPSLLQSFSQNSLCLNKNIEDFGSRSLNPSFYSLLRSPSISSRLDVVDSKSFSNSMRLSFKPRSDKFTLLYYKLMRFPENVDSDEISPNFVSCKNPEPPIIGSYQLEDNSMSSEANANIILRLKLNTEYFKPDDKTKTVEFSRFEVILPFHNRPEISDINKCTVSQGKLVMLEQNRNVLVWNIGSSFKGKKEVSLIGLIKFQQDQTKMSLTDKFCIPPNAYVQINFAFKASNLSGLFIDPKTLSFGTDSGVKFSQKQEFISNNFKIWNTFGDCPIELAN